MSSSLRLFCLACATVFVACSTKPSVGDAGSCGPSNCSGCCNGTTCVAVGQESSSQCGSGGQICGQCSGGGTCSAGACTGGSCNPGNCGSGCCSGTTCEQGTSSAACGANGSACVACGTGQTCVAGSCVTPDAGSGTDAGPGSDAGCTTCDGGTSTRKFDYLVVILMENHNYGDIYGTATYMTGLADQYANLQNYTAVDHPSLPNYLSLFNDLAGDCSNGGAATGGCMTAGGDSTTDCGADPAGSCFMGSNVNLVDRLEAAGLTWQAWNEGAGGACDYQASNVRHVPFLYFDDIVSNSTRCNRVVAATPGADTELINALGSTSTASNFMWLTPDDSHDMHDNSVSSGDSYLQQIVPQILNSNVFKTQKAALFIVFDEGNNNYPGDLLYAVWAGPTVKTAFTSQTLYSHYSFAATLEANWNLPSINSNDANATPMTEVFK